MKRSLHILLLIAFLGGIIAPACGFAWGGAYSVIEICTSQGIETRIVENSDDTPAPMVMDECEFCFTQAKIDFLNENALQMHRVDFVEAARFSTYQDIVISRLPNDLIARGPPIAV